VPSGMDSETCSRASTPRVLTTFLGIDLRTLQHSDPASAPEWTVDPPISDYLDLLFSKFGVASGD